MVDVSPSTQARMDKIEGWLLWGEERYSDLISRPSETASVAGWDNTPRLAPCECKWEWRRGRLCLMCDNTRFRSCAPGDERGVDLYALGVRAVKGGFTARSAGDESAAQKLAARLQLLNAAIARLERDRLQREGNEASPDRAMQQLITLAGERLDREPRSYRKITRAVHHLAARAPWVFDRPSVEQLYMLSRIIPGRLEEAPVGSY